MLRTVFNGTSITAELQRAQEQLEDMTPVYEDIGEYLTEATKRRFAYGISPDGDRWAPKRPATIERYRRMGDGGLTQPLVGPSRRLSNEIHYFADRASVEIGSNLEYAGVMQTGAAKGAFGANARGQPIPWGNIVPRVWLGISVDDESEILDIVDEHLGGTLT